ncbi:MAG: methyltransferase domain-containing protein [Burkholderiales bacterium]
MAIACPVNFNKERLREEVRLAYAEVARNPNGDFHFHRGPEYAARLLGYDLARLVALPPKATGPFCGMGNPFKMAALPVGATVIDIGSGGGMDCLLAARQVGPSGCVIGIDMTDAMLERSRQAAQEAGLDNVRFEKAEMTELPFADNSVDVMISNGVINLAPDKEAVFKELHRVVKPGGRLQFADIIMKTELSEDARNDIDLWTG